MKSDTLEASHKAPERDTFLLRIKRWPSMGGALIDFHIFVDGLKTFKIKNGETAKYKLPAGSHVIKVSTWNGGESKPVTVSGLKDEIVYLTCGKGDIDTGLFLIHSEQPSAECEPLPVRAARNQQIVLCCIILGFVLGGLGAIYFWHVPGAAYICLVLGCFLGFLVGKAIVAMNRRR